MDVRAEVAFGADPATDPVSWMWQDVSADLLAPAVSITRGRQDEAGQVQTSSCRLVLDNQQGHYTPNHPGSPRYPNVVLGVPLRVSVPAGRTFLSVPGRGGASAPDSVASSVTGDIDIRMEAAADIWAGLMLAGKWEGPAALSWLLCTDSDERVVFGWTPDGSDSLLITFPTALPKARRRALRVTLVANDGRGGLAVTLFTAASMAGPWVQLGEPVTAPITTSVFASAVPIRIGTLPNLPAPMLDEVTALEVRRGVNGPIVAAPSFNRYAAGTASFTDPAGRVWTVSGGAEISNLRIRFAGFVAEWSPGWPFGDLSDARGYAGESRVTLTASGILRRLDQSRNTPPSAFRRELLAPTRTPPLHYWPCEEPAGTTSAAPAVGNRTMTVAGDVSFAGVTDVDASAPLPAFRAGQLSTILPSYGLTEQVSMVALLRLPKDGVKAADTPVLTFYGTGLGTAGYYSVEVRPDGALRLRTRSALGATLETTSYSAPLPTNGTTVLVRFSLSKSGDRTTVGLALFDTNTPYGTSITGAFNSVFNLPSAVVIGGWWPGQPSGFADLNGAGIGHIALSTSQYDIDPRLFAAAFGWIGERAAARLRRLCAENQITFGVIGRASDTEPMGPQRVAPLPELLRDCAAADSGILFESRQRPGLAYRTRTSFYNQPAAMSLDAARGPGDIAPGFAPVLDDRYVRNDVTVVRTQGGTARSVDQAHITARGTYDTRDELNLASDIQLADIASWALHLGTDPGMRYPQIEPALTANTDLIDPWLDVDLGDKITVTGLPPQHPPGVVALLAQGYTETLRPYQIRAEVNGSPANLWDVATVSPGNGPVRADSTRTVLATGIGTGEQQFAVTTEGPQWITTSEHSSQFPFLIVVNGETMRVTAIVGRTSPQAFTVVRGIDGLTRSHSAGSVITLARPATIAR